MCYEGIIYRCYCVISKKNYIGQTRHKLNERINAHRWKANHEPNNFYFYNAWNKYGEPSLEWSILERVSSDSLENLCNLLDQREIYWIAQYDSFHNGYNLTPGGSGGIGNVQCKAVKVFKENGELLQICDSIKEAAQIYNVDNSGITKCCKRFLSSAGKKDGYRLIWRYLDDTYTQDDADKLDPIIFDAYFYDTNEFINSYKNIKEFQKYFNIGKSSISNNLNGRSKFITSKDKKQRLYLKYKKWNINDGTSN